jgi:large subunit ribosomal protein L24e
MPQTRECDYCGNDIEPGTGTMFVAVNGSVTHFCSSKCEKNANLGREPRDLEWARSKADARAASEESAPEPEAETTEAEAVEAETTEAETAEAETAEAEIADTDF